MELIRLLEQLVSGGELVDVSIESRAVFGTRVLGVVSVQVAEALNSMAAPPGRNSPAEEMLLAIKSSFGVQPFLEDVADIQVFFSRGKATYVALRELPDDLLLVVPLPSLKTLFVCGPKESPESFGIRI